MDAARECMTLACDALSRAGVGHAVTGSAAVALHMLHRGVQPTSAPDNVDILLKRSDLARAGDALQDAGFEEDHWSRNQVSARAFSGQWSSLCIHLIPAGEVLREGEPEASPGLQESMLLQGVRVLNVLPLVRMALTAGAWSPVRELAAAGVVDESWADRLPTTLGKRLLRALNHPTETSQTPQQQRGPTLAEKVAHCVDYYRPCRVLDALTHHSEAVQLSQGLVKRLKQLNREAPQEWWRDLPDPNAPPLDEMLAELIALHNLDIVARQVVSYISDGNYSLDTDLWLEEE